MPVSDFPSCNPAPATPDSAAEFVLTKADVHTLLGRTEHAISKEETRYYLNGVYLHVEDRGQGAHLYGAATDGHRAAIGSIPAPLGSIGMENPILPRFAVRLLQEAIGLTDAAEVFCRITRLCAGFEVGDFIITAKCIDGEYPDYTRVIPLDISDGCLVRVNRDVFSAAVTSLAPFLPSQESPLALACATPFEVRLPRSVHDTSGASGPLLATHTGPERMLGFQARYLKPLLDQIEPGSDVGIGSNQEAGPVLFRQIGDDSALFIIMPMRLP